MATNTKRNILRDGIENCAASVVEAIRRLGGGCHQVFIADDGAVRVIRDTEIDTRPLRAESELVGRYRKDVPPEVVEDDMIEWLRERPRSAA